MVQLEVTGEIWFWKGPAPHHFVTVPAPLCPAIADVSHLVSYGWGMVPVTLEAGTSRWTTALFPKDGGYILPLKAAVRRAERLDVGDTVTVRLTIEA